MLSPSPSPKKRENAKVEVFEAAGKGMGLKLLEPVSKGQFIAEYVGEVRGWSNVEVEHGVPWRPRK